MATYFIADCHMGASYIADPKGHQRRLAAWLRSIRSDADALYMLGDVLDYWYEYRYVVPRGYTRFFGALAELADAGVKITWLRGNHDIWLFDYLASEIGLTVADGVIERSIDGRRFVMSHGDGIGHQSYAFTALRAMFRSRFLQRLYASVHPRWTVGLAHAWSASNRRHGRPELATHLSDDDRYVRFAREYVESNGPVDYFIFGHRHILIDQTVVTGKSSESRLIVAGDAFSRFTYGRFSDGIFELLTIPESSGDGGK